MPQTAAFLGELRFAARALRRTPLFTTIAVASLGVGLALAATTLAVANAYLLRSLPYPDGRRLYHVMYAPPGPYEPRGMTALDWKGLADVVDAAITTGGEGYFVGDAGTLQFVRATRVSPGFITGLGVQPALGRVFTDEDYARGAPPVALIGHALWRDRFNADPSILGREIRALPEAQTEGPVSIRIVGVLPPGFWFGRTSEARVEMLTPLRAPVRTYMVRLREGVPAALAERRITEAARAVGSDFRPDWTGVHLESAHGRYVRELRPLLFGINAAAGLVLVLVCANVAILVLLRALRRQKEMAVRIALGAGRRHLLRLWIAEAGLLCAGALALGAALTAAALRTLAPAIGARLGRPPPAGPSAIGVDWQVAAMLGGIGLVVALALAWLPLLAPRRNQLADTLRRTGVSATDGPTMRRLRATLVALEVAGALTLLVGGGLMVRSVWNLLRTDLGFDAEHVARVGVVLPPSYREPAAVAQFWEKLGARMDEVQPGLALGSAFPPFFESYKRPLETDASRGTPVPVGGLTVGANYFSVHGIELKQGREFTLADRVSAEPVAIVSESAARQLWPDGGAIGRRLRAVEVSEPDAPVGPWRTVVGVVRDVRQTYDDSDPRDIYFPFLQSATRFGSAQLRTDRAGALTPTRLAALAAEIDPRVRVGEPQMLASADQQFERARFLSVLFGGFAGFAALLAGLGLYGVTAYAVQQREREVAIRLAVGATHRAIVGMFLREGCHVLALGFVLGLLTTFAAQRVVENQIFGVPPYDAVTLVSASVMVATGGFFAIWWPVRRTARTDLLSVLKEE